MKRSIAVAAASLAGLGLLLGVGGLVFVSTGAYNVAATVPHTPLTRWLLDRMQERSVAARADGVPQPPPVDSARAQYAFEHYQEMCVVCHGAPGVERGELGKGINPEPPDLAEAASTWSDRELFWIIKHGIKLAGMPAFGITHSDEEIWGVVAVLRRLQFMPPEEYRRLSADIGVHAGMPGTEASLQADMPATAHGHGGALDVEERARAGMPPADHARTDHAGPVAAPPPAAVPAPPHREHEGVAARDRAGVSGPAGAAEQPPAEPAQVDAEATQRLKTLATELLRDAVVVGRIRADSTLRRHWESEAVREQLTPPLE